MFSVSMCILLKLVEHYGHVKIFFSLIQKLHLNKDTAQNFTLIISKLFQAEVFNQSLINSFLHKFYSNHSMRQYF